MNKIYLILTVLSFISFNVHAIQLDEQSCINKYKYSIDKNETSIISEAYLESYVEHYSTHDFGGKFGTTLGAALTLFTVASGGALAPGLIMLGGGAAISNKSSGKVSNAQVYAVLEGHEKFVNGLAKIVSSQVSEKKGEKIVVSSEEINLLIGELLSNNYFCKNSKLVKDSSMISQLTSLVLIGM